jgi:GTP pyrophosphokinase
MDEISKVNSDSFSNKVLDLENIGNLFDNTYKWANKNIPNFNELCINNSQELVSSHILGVYNILSSLDIDTYMTKSCVLFALYPQLQNYFSTHPHQQNIFNPDTIYLSASVYKLLQTTEQFTSHSERINNSLEHQATLEILRKMLLASAQDIRAIVIMLASQLQTLHWHAKNKTEPSALWVKDVLNLYAPLANRLGIWQLKWELEDLAFRFMEPISYRQIASLLDEKRVEREQFIEEMKQKLIFTMKEASINADISGRPKHIYSIWKKMHGKNLSFTHLYDVRAFRIIVKDIKDCYTALGVVHNLWTPVPKEFDDYISQAKPNGYQSLHTVVIADDGKAIEIQIRTAAMHKQAEFGVAAHWRYKEAGTKGYSGEFSAVGSYEEKIALLRQLLEWKEDSEIGYTSSSLDNNFINSKNTKKNDLELSSDNSNINSNNKINPEERWEKIGSWVDDHIYVFTPQAKVIALPVTSTALDFAYHVHTNIGHRCRGAKVDGKMVPLYTSLENGQTVEVITVKEGGPSRNWLRNQPQYLISNRARSKVRAWFNALELEETINKGRVILEKILQREGKTGINLEELSHNCRYKNSNDLFLSLAKDLVSSKYIEDILSLHYRNKSGVNNNSININNSSTNINDINTGSSITDTSYIIKTKRQSNTKTSKKISVGVSVMGLDSLVMQMAKCCKPIPGDDIVGFITKGKGITIHRTQCASMAKYNQKYPERLIDAQWKEQESQRYIVDLYIEAHDRQGLLRDLGHILSKEKINVISTQSKSRNNVACLTFTLELFTKDKLQQAITMIQKIKSVVKVERKYS